MYIAVIHGVAIQCETAADAIRLANEVAASNGPTPPATPPLQAPAPSMVTPQITQITPADLTDEMQAQSKWTGPAKEVIARLVEAGADGLDIERVAEIAGLKGPKGSPPLLKVIIELLGVDAGVIKRVRTDEGKRWVLAPRGAKAAKKLGLLPNGEASRP